MPNRETIILTGNDENRLAQLLRAARHQIRVAQVTASPRMQDTLTDLEDILADQLAAVRKAADADKSDAAPPGVRDRKKKRLSWRLSRAA